MSFPEPPQAKAQVRRAGKIIAKGQETPDDIAVVDQWRAAHSYVLNTFKVWLLHKIRASGINAEFAQRLKRRNTVIDKLRRTKPDGTPLIRDVTSMHDFAGCRIIFDNIDDLQEFRKYLHSPKVLGNVDHKPKHPDFDKYNYIESPKITGYRGIHDVFLHHPRPHRAGTSTSGPWQGLMVEIQYRTRAQHAWATALEISDLIDGQRTKFGHGEDARGEFFAMASEIIARRHEGMQRAYAELETHQLETKFYRAEEQLHILQRLNAMRQFELYDQLRKHNVLNIVRSGEGYSLEIEVFSSSRKAIDRANELESSADSLNAVYVTGEPAQLKSAYRNYFNDPVDFVQLLART